MAAEMVRKKVLAHTRAELPFSTAVAVDEFDESERDHLLRIDCTIFVEQTRRSQSSSAAAAR